MREETRSQLNLLLEQHQLKLDAARTQEEQRQAAGLQFLDDFKALVHGVIRPAMEEIGERLKAAGHTYRIDERHRQAAGKSDSEQSTIAMFIHPAGYETRSSTSSNTPEIRFTADADKKVVHSHLSTMLASTGTLRPPRDGLAGPGHIYSLLELTASPVEDEVLSVLRGVLG
jgi:hypothetical protein